MYVVIAIVIALAIESVKYIKVSPTKMLSKSWFRYMTYVVLFIAIIGAWIFLKTSSVESSFIYFEF